jgi:hypothetical protein
MGKGLEFRLSGSRGSGLRLCRNFIRVWKLTDHAESAGGFSFVARALHAANPEAAMKATLLLTGALIFGCAGTALADEYYVVQGPSHHCTITTTRPADKEVVTQIGPLAFKSRVEAENRIKQTKVCSDDATVGTGSTTVIKEK